MKTPVTLRRVRRPLLRGFACALLLAAACAGRADERRYPFTYDWFQSAKGERELAIQSTSFGRDNLFQHEIELEYGFTNRFSLAPYIVFESGEGRTLHYDAFQLEARYQLGNFKPGRVLPGLYLEYEKETDEGAELEGKLILSRYDRKNRDVSFNYIIEQHLQSGTSAEHAYSIGASTPVAARVPGLRAGVEWIHHLTGGRINFGPAVGFRPGPGTWVIAGVAFPLNSLDSNRTEVRLRLQHHWF